MGSAWQAAFVCLFVAQGAFLFGLDIGYIGPILECASFKRDIGRIADFGNPTSRIPDAASGFLVGIFSIGCIATSVPAISGYFLEEWGRRSSVMFGSAVFLLGCALQAKAPSMHVMLWGRLVAGLSIGILSSTVSLYQSELSPPHLRGALTSLYQLMITFGILCAAALDGQLVHLDDGWRWAILAQALPAACLFLAMPLMPRSPRWLVQKGRQQEALHALQLLRNSDAEAQDELMQIVRSHQETLELGTPHCLEIFRGRTGRLLVLAVMLQMLQQLVGMNAFMYFGPRIFAQLGQRASVLQTVANLVNFLATIPALFMADLFGRRILLVCSAIGMVIACLGMGIVGLSITEYASSAQGNASSGTIVILMLFFIANFAYGWGPMVWVYCSEIFPMRHRGLCMSAAACSNWVGNFVVAQLTPVLLGILGFNTFFVFAVFCLAALALAIWLPETKGLMLEHVGDVLDGKLGLSMDKEASMQNVKRPTPEGRSSKERTYSPLEDATDPHHVTENSAGPWPHVVGAHSMEIATA